jgi:hypothetical protein
MVLRPETVWMVSLVLMAGLGRKAEVIGLRKNAGAIGGVSRKGWRTAMTG